MLKALEEFKEDFLATKRAKKEILESIDREYSKDWHSRNSSFIKHQIIFGFMPYKYGTYQREVALDIMATETYDGERCCISFYRARADYKARTIAIAEARTNCFGMPFLTPEQAEQMKHIAQKKVEKDFRKSAMKEASIAMIRAISCD